MSGTVSSLGSSQINSQLATVEARLQKPITQLQAQVTTEKTSISAWSAIQGTVSSLSSALAGIKDVSSITNRSATSSATTIATATATDTSQTGQYNLTNITLAKQQEIYSAAQTSASAPLSSGGSLTITLKSGKTEQVPVAASSATLNGIAQAINKLGGGVKASIIGGTGGSRLVLQSSATGGSQSFTVAGTGGLAKFSYAPTSSGTSSNFTLAQTASSATLKINGVPVSNATNTLTTSISGVTLNLAASGSTKVTVGSSPGALAGALDSVATSLNAAIAAIAKQTAYVAASSANAASASSAKAGPLLGNFAASDLSNQLLTAVTGAAANGVTSNSVGLTVSSTGAVSFNSGTFATAYAANPTAVASLVSQIYKTLSTVTTGAIGSGSSGTNKGSINAQTTSLQNQVTSLTSEASQIAKSNNDELQILIQQYSVAEAAATTAATTQAYLSIFSSASTTSKG
ncbi:MAG: flagellar filament capping protein FliD [Acidocella sp.]|nr:flagellar filament capping protein FliD [Acidocella sp.]